MNFDHASVTCTVTYACNYNCTYCSQNQFLKNPKTLSIKIFKILIDKIFKENLKTLDFSLLGGELSTDFKYLEYFEYILSKNKEQFLNNTYLDNLNIVFLSNFSGTDLFFIKLIEIIEKYKVPNLTFNFEITIHKEYSHPEKIIKKLENFHNYIKSLKNIYLIVNFLDDYQKLKIKETYYKDYEIFDKYLDIQETSKFKVFFKQLITNEIPLKKTNQKRLCNALYYNITPDGKIVDTCRDITLNFINFKFIKNTIHCSKTCPCEHLNTEFNQLPDKMDKSCCL